MGASESALTSRGRTLARLIGAGLVGLVIGWVAGTLVARPSDEGVREGVETLLPPDAVTIDRDSGGSDWSPLRASYQAHVDFEWPASPPGEVVQRARRAAEEADWRVVRMEEPPAGARLYVEKGMLRATLHLRHRWEAGIHRYSVRRRLDAIGTVARTSGAVAAVAAMVLWGLLDPRRRGRGHGRSGGGRSS